MHAREIRPAPDLDVETLTAYSQLRYPKPTRVAFKVGRKIVFLDPMEITTVEANGNYVLLHHASGSHLIRDPIGQIEEALGPHGFVRIHRGLLVNAGVVKEFMRTASGDYLIRTVSGKEYKVSRTYKANVRFFAASWVGATFE